MRKKVSRVAISMCAVASMVLSVAAPAMTVAAETTDEPTEITVWAWDKNMNGTAMEVADSLDDNVKVNFVEMAKADCLQKIHTVLASGVTDDLPDIVLISDLNAQGYLMSYPDAFLPMDDYISYDDFAAYKKDMLSYDGAGYGVPFDTGVAGLFYRTDYMVICFRPTIRTISPNSRSCFSLLENGSQTMTEMLISQITMH